MRPTSVTVSGATGSSATIPLNWRSQSFAVGFGVVITGTLTYKVEHTFDNVFDASVTPTWFDHDLIVGQTANADGNYAFPIVGMRLTVTAWTSGSATLTVVQGGQI